MKDSHALKRIRIKLKQDLQRSAHTRRLHFPPQPTLVAPHTIHDPRDISEVLLKLVLQRLYTQELSLSSSTQARRDGATYQGVLTLEQGLLVEPPHLMRDLHDLVQLLEREGVRGGLVRLGLHAAVVVRGEVGPDARDGAEEEDRVEVDVLEPLGV